MPPDVLFEDVDADEFDDELTPRQVAGITIIRTANGFITCTAIEDMITVPEQRVFRSFTELCRYLYLAIGPRPEKDPSDG